MTAHRLGADLASLRVVDLDRRDIGRASVADEDVQTQNVDDVYELSPLQRGLLLHSVHDGASDMYLSQQTYTFSGRLDSAVLVDAWNAAAQAHPAMRTSFHWKELDTPLQVVHRHVPVPVAHHAWAELPPAEQQTRVVELQVSDRARGFDLSSPPLQRLNLVELASDRFTVIWTYHHLLLDGWSIPVFTGEVLGQYQRLALGSAAPPAAPPYRDYIAWLQRQDPERTQTYWTELLTNTTPSHLTAMRTGDARRSTGSVDRRTQPMPAGLLSELQAFGVRHRVTLSTIIQGAWTAVLSRHSDTSEVTYGCVSSGRPPELREIDRMVGMFANTLPMRVSLEPTRSIGTWLSDLQALQAGMRRYEFTPLSDIKRWAGAAGRPLFDTNLSVENFNSAFDTAPGGDESGFHRDELYDKTNDPVAVTVTPDPLTIDLMVHRDRFPDGFADTLVDGLAAALQAVGRAETVADLVSAVWVAAPVPRDVEATPAVAGAPVDSVIGRAVVPDAAETEGLRRHVLAVFREVLERDDIDADTDFFDLGGDSFDAVRVVSRIDDADLGLLATFPTAQELAEALAGLGGRAQVSMPVRGPVHTKHAGPQPCTYQQEGVWYQHKDDPRTTVLHVPTALLLRGPLDVPALERCLLMLVTRHESLRSRFVDLEGVPHQIIDDPPPQIAVERVDLARSQVQDWVAARHRTPFDLATDGVLRLGIGRVSAHEHVVMMEVHHIAVDGWSSKVLAAELSALYAAERAASTVTPENAQTTAPADILPAAPIQPADYAIWQRTDNAAVIDRHVEWWRRELDGVATLDLPTDRPRPAAPTGAGQVIEDQLSLEVTAALHEYAQTERVSVLAILHAGLLVALERHTGQHDIAIGSLFAGRSSPDIEPVVGCFLSIPVLRVALGDGDDFAELVRRCHQTIGAANAHLDAPFPKVVAALGPQRLAGRNPLFQVGLTFLPRSVGAGLELAGISGDFVPVPDDYALWDLSVDASDAPDDRLHVSMEYSTDLFDADRIRRLLDQMLLAVSNGLAHPETAYDELPLELGTPTGRSGSDRGPRHGLRLLRSRRKVGRPRTVDQLLTRTARRRPNDVAIRTPDGSVSFGQLHRAAHALTGLLRERGIRSGSVVTLALPPGPAQLAAALAGWRCGATLVLLDPSSDDQVRRTSEPATGSSPAVVVTGPATAERFEDALVADWPSLESAGGFAPLEPSAAELDGCAVLVRVGEDLLPLTHRRLGQRLQDLQEHCALRARDVALWRSVAAVSVWTRQVLWPLVIGASCVVGVSTGRENDLSLVTHLDASGPELPGLLMAIDFDGPSPLQSIVVDGPVAAGMLDTIRGRFPTVSVHRIIDHPQVGLVGCSEPETGRGTTAGGECRLLVLDDRGRQAPLGVPGWLHVSGPGTTETGAGAPVGLGLVAEQNADGSVHVWGQQERYRRRYGHRYHLDAVADVVSRLPGVRDLVLCATGDEAPVGYLVVDPERSLAKIQDELRDVLAVHLRPSRVVTIPHVPLTADGRVDEQALPRPRPVEEVGSSAEDVVVAAASDLLDGRSLGRHDDLFAYGLTSLGSTQLIARLDSDLGVRLSARDVLVNPSVAELARLVVRRCAERSPVLGRGQATVA